MGGEKRRSDLKIKKKQGRSGKRPRVVVLYQPPYDSSLGKLPHPVLIARGHFGSPDELTTECQARIGILPRHHRDAGTVLVGHEVDEHIVSEAFEKKGMSGRCPVGYHSPNSLQGTAVRNFSVRQPQRSLSRPIEGQARVKAGLFYGMMPMHI